MQATASGANEFFLNAPLPRGAFEIMTRSILAARECYDYRRSSMQTRTKTESIILGSLGEKNVSSFANHKSISAEELLVT